MYQVLYLGDIWNYIMENFPNEYNLTSKSFAKNNLCKNYTQKKSNNISIKWLVIRFVNEKNEWREGGVKSPF